MSVTFDGPNKQVVLDSVTTEYTAVEIYSRWKDWVSANNAQYLEAFGSVGGDPLGGGQVAPAYIFLRNDLGWRIKRPEATINVIISGNLVAADPLIALLTGPNGAFSPTITITRSETSTFSATELWSALLSDFGGADTMGAAIALLSKIARNRQTVNQSTGKLTVYDDDNTTVLLEGNVYKDAAGTIPYQGDGIERRDRLT
jgi:hypothetical protein